MFVSKYNNYCKKEDCVIVYNSFSGAIVSLSQYEYDFLMDLNKKDTKDTYNEKERKMVNDFIRGGFIESKSNQQLNKLRFESYLSRFNKDNLCLTIAPTTACNFRCPYCYEKGIIYDKISSEIIENTIKFINSFGCKNIDICWYGGEPLLCIDDIVKIVNGIRKEDVNINQSIVTNGYLLNDEISRKLFEIGVSTIQITLDGPKTIHDSRRYLYNGGGTFDVIINNLIEQCEKFKISIRVNVDKTNLKYVKELILYLKKVGIYDKVHFYLAQVDNINDNSDLSSLIYDDFELNDFFKLECELANELISKGDLNSFEERNPYLCGAVSPNSFLIDPKGNLYKCWNDIGREEYIVGNIKDGITNEMELYSWLGYDCFESISCKNCSLFPLCLNGCPHSVIRKNSKKCHSNRHNIERLLDKIL